MEQKVFAALGVITVICGLYLTITGSYIQGIGGTVVGIWLAADNIKKIRANG